MIADSLSRRDKVIQTEWSLHQQIFNQICRVWHTPMVDLFATHLNHKLSIYVSPVPDKKAWKTDALNICWEGLDSYVFCQVAILPQVIQRIITPMQDDCVDSKVARDALGLIWWISRPGYSKSSLTGRLKQPHSNRFDNKVEYLNLHVWLLHSRNPVLEDSHLRWQKELRHLRGNPQETSSWAIYGQWCSQNKVDVTSTTVPQIAEFLNYLFTVKNLKPATITGYRTTIADALVSQCELISKRHNM